MYQLWCNVLVSSVMFSSRSTPYHYFHYRGGRYAEDDAKTIVVQILRVVAFCHLQGVVHRDLKPEVYV